MSWSVEEVDGAVRATFTGHLTAEEGTKSALAFAALLVDRKRAIFEVTEMTGYEGGARKAWQKHLLPVRGNIESITVVGGSKLIHMGASILGMFLRVPVHFGDPQSETEPSPR